MAVDAKGNIYLTGSTSSADLGTLGAFQSRRASSNLISFDASTGKLASVFPSSTSAVILSLAPDPRRPGTVYAGTDSGLIKTTDNGLTWITLSGGLPSGWLAPFI